MFCERCDYFSIADVSHPLFLEQRESLTAEARWQIEEDRRKVDAHVEKAVDRAVRSTLNGRLHTVYFGDSHFADNRHIHEGLIDDGALLCHDGVAQDGTGQTCGVVAVGGESWRLALTRAWMVCSLDADVVFVELGTNDLLWGVPPWTVVQRAMEGLNYLGTCTDATISVQRP